MASIVTQADLKKGLVPLDAELFATSKGEVSKTGMHVPDLDLIDGKNIMPTVGGYTSFFGMASKIGATTGPDKIQKPITYRTYSGNTVVIAFARDGLYLKSLAGDGTGAATVVETGTEVTIDLEDYLYLGWTKVFSTSPTGVWENWTWAILKNKIYLYQKGMNVILRLDGDVYGKIILTKLNPTYIIGTGQASKVIIHSQDIYDSAIPQDTYKQFTYKINGQALATFKLDLNEYVRISSAPIKWEGMIADTGLFNVNVDVTAQSNNIGPINVLLPPDYSNVISNQNLAIASYSDSTIATIDYNVIDPNSVVNWYPVDGRSTIGYDYEIKVHVDFLYFLYYTIYDDPTSTVDLDITITVEGVEETHKLFFVPSIYTETESDFHERLSDFFLQFTNITVRSIWFNSYYSYPSSSAFGEYRLYPKVSTIISSSPTGQFSIKVYDNNRGNNYHNYFDTIIGDTEPNNLMSTPNNGFEYDSYYLIVLPEEGLTGYSEQMNTVAGLSKMKLGPYETTYDITALSTIWDAAAILWAQMASINPTFKILDRNTAIWFPQEKPTQLFCYFPFNKATAIISNGTYKDFRTTTPSSLRDEEVPYLDMNHLIEQTTFV